MSQTRSVWAKAFRSLLTSLKPRQVRGNFMGKDYFGTKYFEIPADPQAGKRKPERWFLPLEKNKFDQEIPSEWEGSFYACLSQMQAKFLSLLISP